MRPIEEFLLLASVFRLDPQVNSRGICFGMHEFFMQDLLVILSMGHLMYLLNVPKGFL